MRLVVFLAILCTWAAHSQEVVLMDTPDEKTDKNAVETEPCESSADSNRSNEDTYDSETKLFKQGVHSPHCQMIADLNWKSKNFGQDYIASSDNLKKLIECLEKADALIDGKDYPDFNNNKTLEAVAECQKLFIKNYDQYSFSGRGAASVSPKGLADFLSKLKIFLSMPRDINCYLIGYRHSKDGKYKSHEVIFCPVPESKQGGQLPQAGKVSDTNKDSDYDATISSDGKLMDNSTNPPTEIGTIINYYGA